MRKILLFGVLCFSTGHAPAQEPVFHSGIRLVEVDAVVRDKNGPVTGLTADDFTLYDCKASQRDLNHPFNPCKGKKQPLALFREIHEGNAVEPSMGSLHSGTATAPPLVSSLPPGTVSNRADSNGKPITTATAVVVDQLNTPFDVKGHQRLELINFLQSVGDQDRIAVYSLGKDLHLLQDFTDDPKKLIDSVTKLDSGDQLTPAQDIGANGEIRTAESVTIACIKQQITENAVEVIVRHMEGVPGRKNLVWIAQGFGAFGSAPSQCGPPKAAPMLGQANIATYPVMVRSLGSSGVLDAQFNPRTPPPPTGDLGLQHFVRELGESLGGAGFVDAADILAAVRRAENDSRNYYVLGFYPADSDIDGGTHQLTLGLSRRVAGRAGLELHYRQTYRATLPRPLYPGEQPSITDIFHSPLDATTIGLTAAVKPDPAKPGARFVEVTIDLADIQFQPRGDRWVGSLQMAMRLEAKDSDVQVVTEPVTQTVPLSFSEGELAAKRASGLNSRSRWRPTPGRAWLTLWCGTKRTALRGR